MIFLVQFGINKYLLIFPKTTILLVFEKFTRAYLFQIALEIMWLPRQITFKLGCEQQKTPTNRKCYANPVQQIGNVTQIQRNKLSNVYFLFFVFGAYDLNSIWFNLV